MRRLARLLPLLALAACSQAPQQVFKFDKPLMHTRWDFSLCASSEGRAKAAFGEAAAEVERLDKVLAMWQPQSELALFNAKAGQGPQKVSDDLDAVLALGQAASEISSGASDSTVGPLVQLWYDSLKKGGLPLKAAIDAALTHVDWHRLRREGKLLWSTPAGTRIDLGSVAKGYAQDKAAAILRRRGVKSFLMNAGGQVYAAGHKPDGSKWSVGVINPRDAKKLVTVMQLEDQGMSTSGDYEQGSFVKGKRYHHIIDPHTGWPVANGVCSVTVIFPLQGAKAPGAGSWCDALDTAALVMGMQKGRAMLEAQKASAILIHEGKGHTLDAAVTEDLKGKAKLVLN